MTSCGWQLVVEDPSCLSGTAVAEAIRGVADSVGARFVVVDEVEGRGDVRLRLVSPDLLIFPDQGVAELAERMMQFEWGDFFFFQTKDEAGSIRLEDSCPSRVASALVTIRCVDNTYFYFYGTDMRIRKALLGRFNVRESKEGPVSELDYPR